MYEWQTLSSKWIKLKKERRCDGCGRLWPCGAQMYQWVGAFHDVGGSALRTCVCVVCRAFMDARRSIGYPGFDAPPSGSLWELDDEEYEDVEANALAVLIMHGVPTIKQYCESVSP